MSEKQWYRLLLENNCTMESRNGDDQAFKLCRVELAHPETDWERSWRLARLPGLGPGNISFIFKMLHQILPTQERLARTTPRTSSDCLLPGCINLRDDLPHALVLCQGNDGVGARMMASFRSFSPNLDIGAALRLEFAVDEDVELPLASGGSLPICLEM